MKGARERHRAPRPIGRPRKVTGLEGRVRFMNGCFMCEHLRDEYMCEMPYHEPHYECSRGVSHCVCEHCWPIG